MLPPKTHLVFRSATVVDFRPRIGALLEIRELKRPLHTSKYVWTGHTSLAKQQMPVTSFNISIVTLDGYICNIGEWQLKLRLD